MGRQVNSIAVSLSLALLAATSGLTGCGGEGSNPNDITVVEVDEAGISRELRSASELEVLLKDARATAAG